MISVYLLTCINILAVFVFSQSSYSQVTRQWVQRFDGKENKADLVNSMHLDAESNVYVYGVSTSENSLTDIALVKYNSAGVLMWNKLFNGFGNSVDQVNASLLDNSGNSYITGYTADTNLVIKIITLKYDINGTLLWKNIFLPPAYNQGMAQALAFDNQGNIFSAGSLRRTNGRNDIVILKYSQTGTLLNSIIYNEGDLVSETPVSIRIDQNNNLYVFGSLDSPSLSETVVLKFAPALNFIWRKTLTGSSASPDITVQMVLDNSGRPLVCMGMNNNGSGFDYGVFLLDTSSALQSQYVYNGTDSSQDIPYACMFDNSNNLYVTGSSRNADTLGSEDFLTVKLSSSLNLLWERRYDGSAHGIDYGTALAKDISGNVYVGGASDKGNNRVEYSLLKYSPSGALQWEERYSRIFYSEDFVYSVAADNSNNIFVTGISFDSLSDYDIATIKYSQSIGITPVSNEIPRSMELYQNYPNPFNPSTKIRFDISIASDVWLRVYDLKGSEVAAVFSGELSPGGYEADFNAEKLSAGAYIYSLQTSKGSVSKRMILLK